MMELHRIESAPAGCKAGFFPKFHCYFNQSAQLVLSPSATKSSVSKTFTLFKSAILLSFENVGSFLTQECLFVLALRIAKRVRYYILLPQCLFPKFHSPGRQDYQRRTTKIYSSKRRKNRQRKTTTRKTHIFNQ